MIGLSRSVRVYVWREPVDMRKSFNGLSGIVIEQMARPLGLGEVYLFVGKDRRRAKALLWDGTGVCLYSKRLSKGRFASPWERAVGEDIVLTYTELSAFFEGAEQSLRERLSPTEHRPEKDRLQFG
jgi:transposase